MEEPPPLSCLTADETVVLFPPPRGLCPSQVLGKRVTDALQTHPTIFWTCCSQDCTRPDRTTRQVSVPGSAKTVSGLLPPACTFVFPPSGSLVTNAVNETGKQHYYRSAPNDERQERFDLVG